MEAPSDDIWFVVGPSGVGKTTFATSVAAKNHWFHYDIDQPGHDGIDHYGLRPVWDEFFSKLNAEPLVRVLRERFRCCKGAIVSFSSLVCFQEAHVLALRSQAVKVVCLYGTPTDCKAAFDERESKSSRNLEKNHWENCNLGKHNIYALLEAFAECYQRLKIDAFEANGTHIPFEKLYDQVSKRPI